MSRLAFVCSPRMEGVMPGSNVTREPVKQRAGTVMGPGAARIYGEARRGSKLHGLLDPDSRVYQTGGELGNFLYRKGGVLSIPRAVWEEIRHRATAIEIVDHEANECWSVDVWIAATHGDYYDAGIGMRFGVPLACWSRRDADGRELPTGGKIAKPAEPPPANQGRLL